MFVEIRYPSRTNERMFFARPVKSRKPPRRRALRVTVVFAEIFFRLFPQSRHRRQPTFPRLPLITVRFPIVFRHSVDTLKL